MLLHPEKLSQARPSIETVSGYSVELDVADLTAEHRFFGGRASVRMDHRRQQRFTARFDEDQTQHVTGNAHRHDLGPSAIG
jgi:ribosomal protein L31